MFRRRIHQPKKTLLQIPGLWLPGSPAPGALGFWPRCCCGEDEEAEDCEHCSSGRSPLEFSVTIPAITDGSCDECEQYQGTYTVQQRSGTACWWQYTIPGFLCGYYPYSTVTVRISADQILVNLNPSGVLDLLWSADIPNDDCDTWSNISLPYVSRFYNICDATGTTASISAL